MIKRIVFLLFLIIGVGFGSICQSINPSNLRFQYLTTADGLPQNTIDCIFHDSQRFMWFGTWNGLCRYDGYSFKIFQKGDSEKSLPDNFVRAICEDKSKNLWIGTSRGIGIYNLATEQFFMPDSLHAKLENLAVTSLSCDKDGGIWIAAEKGKILHIIPKPSTQREFECAEINTEALNNEDVNTVCVLKDGRVLAASGNGPFEVFESKLRRLELPGNVSGQFESANILCIYESANGNWWFGSDIGLFWYRRSTKQLTFYTYQPNNKNSLGHATVMAITEESPGTILIGTLGGLNFFHPETETFSRIEGRLDENGTLNNEFVNSLLADIDGNVWIGTEKGGVNKYSSFQKPFYSLRNHPDEPNSLSSNTINSILNDGNILWVGTAGGGLNRVHQNTGKIDHFIHSAQKADGISSDYISSLCLDAENRLWYTSWGNGIGRLVSAKNKTFKNYLNELGNPRSLVSNFVSGIYHDARGFFVVGTSGGLDLFDPKTESFFHFQEKFDINVETPAIGCILKDSKDFYWIGTRKGLFQIPAKQLVPTPEKLTSEDFRFFTNEPGDSLSLSGNYVTSLLEDHRGNIWVGTYGNGICKVQKTTDGKIQFIAYTKTDGLCNNVVYAMEEDLSGNIWISTDKGLSKFNSETGFFQNFFTKDGLLNDQFYWTSSALDNQGNLYFGGVNGLNYFNPGKIDFYPRLPNVVFTDFQVFNQSVKIGHKLHGNVILQQSIAETQTIELSYKDNIFSIEFSALDYFLPDKVIYAYKMEGVDQNWVTVTAFRRFATYTNLSGGEYRFLVKAANSDGLWSAEPSVLRIIIDPPFWQTSWFRFLAILALAFSVMGYIRYRTRYLHEQKRKLEIQVRERTLQIEEQKEKLQEQAEILLQSNTILAERRKLIEGQKIELENQNQLIVEQRDEVIELNKKVSLINQLRLRFFTNISHEFRTPLTLIIDPLEQLMQNFKDDKNTKNTLSIINRNAQRLLYLINQLLYFRKIETGNFKLNVSKGNMLQYLGGIFESFKELAEHQQIDYQFLAEKNKDETWFDAEKIENILYNLLSNAFKNTPVTGSIKMIVNFEENEVENCIPVPFVSICIKDSGSGIAKEHLPYVFDRFYKAGQTNADTNFTSSGIGLALTYEIVQALHGEIRAESEPGKGSSFTFFIPYTNDRFSADEINQTAAPTDINIEDRLYVLKELIVTEDAGYDTEFEMPDDKLKPILLIVEDNLDLRSFLMQTLHSDYRVLGAENGKIGFEIASKEIPDIVVSDIMMPVMDGIEMCKLMKHDVRTSHIPIVLLTAKESVPDQKTGYDAGADSYLTKPFSSNLLMSRLKNILDARKKFSLSGAARFKQKQELLNESIGELDKEFLKKLTTAIEENLEDEELNISYIAAQMNMSHSTLYRKIKALTNLTANEFIRNVRINFAEKLLLTGQYNISEIMFRVGINSSSYFRQCFKEEFGMNPSEYLQKLKENQKRID